MASGAALCGQERDAEKRNGDHGCRSEGAFCCAVYAASDSTRLYFEGNVHVHGDTDATGGLRNVVFAYNKMKNASDHGIIR